MKNMVRSVCVAVLMAVATTSALAGTCPVDGQPAKHRCKGKIRDHVEERSPVERQEAEDRYVAVAEQLERLAIHANELGELVLDDSVALALVDNDLGMLEHFRQKLELLNKRGQAKDVRKGTIAHPLYGERIEYVGHEKALTMGSAVTLAYYLPFTEGQTWVSNTYSGHLPCGSNSWDWTRVGTTSGSVVRASASGKLYARYDTCKSCPFKSECGTKLAKGYGSYLIIDHADGNRTFYGHLSEISRPDGSVSRGVMIGRVGSTGCSTGAHLHTDRRSIATGACVTQRFVEGVPSAGAQFKSQNK